MNRTHCFLACCASFLLAPCALAQPESVGQWQTTVDDLPVLGIHSVLLRTGKVLCAGLRSSDPLDKNVMVVDVSDPGGALTWDDGARLQQQNIPGPDPDRPIQLFCSAHVQAGPKVLWVGGGATPEQQFSRDYSVLFDPDAVAPTVPWTLTDDLPEARWYPTCTVLGDGRVVVMGGRDWISGCHEDFPQNRPVVYKTATGAYENPLSDAPQQDLVYYPFAFQFSTNFVMIAGSNDFGVFCDNPRRNLRLDVLLSKWQDGATYAGHTHGASAVMYDVDKILKVGAAEGDGGIDDTSCSGGSAAERRGKSAWRYDPSLSQWIQVPCMIKNRIECQLVVLPDGSALALGGASGGMPHEPTPAEMVLAPELINLNDANPHWSELAQMNPGRSYHSSALLLPDGRVFITGGQSTAAPSIYKSAQCFKPPYFFNSDGSPAPRPVITTNPLEIEYGKTFQVVYSLSDTTRPIKAVNLIRLGAATHGFDQDTRCVPLNYSETGPNELKVAAPAHGYMAPPGYYMLFVLQQGDRAGVQRPSVGKIIHVKPA